MASNLPITLDLHSWDDNLFVLQCVLESIFMDNFILNWKYKSFFGIPCIYFLKIPLYSSTSWFPRFVLVLPSLIQFSAIVCDLDNREEWGTNSWTNPASENVDYKKCQLGRKISINLFLKLLSSQFLFLVFAFSLLPLDQASSGNEGCSTLLWGHTAL